MSGGPPAVREGPREHNESHRGTVQQLGASGPPIMLLKGVVLVSRSLNLLTNTISSPSPVVGQAVAYRIL